MLIPTKKLYAEPIILLPKSAVYSYSRHSIHKNNNARLYTIRSEPFLYTSVCAFIKGSAAQIFGIKNYESTSLESAIVPLNPAPVKI